MSEAYHEFCSIEKIPQVGNQLICEKDAIYPDVWLWTNRFTSMGLNFLIFKMKIGKNNFLGWKGDFLCVTAGLITQGNPAHLPSWTRGYSLWSQGLSPSCWHLSWRKSSQRKTTLSSCMEDSICHVCSRADIVWIWILPLSLLCSLSVQLLEKLKEIWKLWL